MNRSSWAKLSSCLSKRDAKTPCAAAQFRHGISDWSATGSASFGYVCLDLFSPTYTELEKPWFPSIEGYNENRAATGTAIWSDWWRRVTQASSASTDSSGWGTAGCSLHYKSEVCQKASWHVEPRSILGSSICLDMMEHIGTAGLFSCFICEFPLKLWLQWPDLYRRHTRSFDFHLYSRISWHFISLRISIPLQSATRVENRSRKQEMDTKDCTECSFCVTVLLYCCVPNGKLDSTRHWLLTRISCLFRAFLNDLECLVQLFTWVRGMNLQEFPTFLYEVRKEMRLETSSWMLIVYEKFKPKSVNTSQTSNSQRGCNYSENTHVHYGLFSAFGLLDSSVKFLSTEMFAYHLLWWSMWT